MEGGAGSGEDEYGSEVYESDGNREEPDAKEGDSKEESKASGGKASSSEESDDLPEDLGLAGGEARHGGVTAGAEDAAKGEPAAREMVTRSKSVVVKATA